VQAKGLTELSPGVCVQCDNKPSLLQKSQIVYPFVVNLGNETGCVTPRVRGSDDIACPGSASSVELSVCVCVRAHLVVCSRQVKLATSTQAELLDWTKRISEAFVVKHVRLACPLVSADRQTDSNLRARACAARTGEAWHAARLRRGHQEVEATPRTALRVHATVLSSSTKGARGDRRPPISRVDGSLTMMALARAGPLFPPRLPGRRPVADCIYDCLDRRLVSTAS